MDGLELGRPMEGKPRDLSDKTQPVCFGYILCTGKPRDLDAGKPRDLTRGKSFCFGYIQGKNKDLD